MYLERLWVLGTRLSTLWDCAQDAPIVGLRAQVAEPILTDTDHSHLAIASTL